MNNGLEIVQTSIIANAIIDWCNSKAKEHLINFNNNYVSSYIKFRFTTPMILKILPFSKDGKGYWKIGNHILYEIVNVNGNIKASLLVSKVDLKEQENYKSLLIANNLADNELVTVKTWNIFSSSDKLENLNHKLDIFFNTNIKTYEDELAKWLEDKNYIFQKKQNLIEGAEKIALHGSFERNAEARIKCIEYHGSKCKICGFDFGEVFGDEFDGKIEVHHIKPLSEIRKEHVVDPIHDLIPVCPNCHTILHSKKGGVYTPEEVVNMFNNNK